MSSSSICVIKEGLNDCARSGASVESSASPAAATAESGCLQLTSSTHEKLIHTTSTLTGKLSAPQSLGHQGTFLVQISFTQSEKMQDKVFFTHSKAAVALCIVLLMLTQQVCAGPLPPQVRSEQSPDVSVRSLRRTARMTPLWRIMSSKPYGAFCQNNYECSTGLC
ncbi:hypothetical protein F7725_004840, partial [Dissostichus mawsoni]